VFSFDFQFFLAGFANPVVLSVDEGVIVNALAVILGAKITFHNRDSGPVSGRLLFRFNFLNFLEGFSIGDLRCDGGHIFAFNSFIDLVPINRNVRRRLDTQADIITADTEYLNLDLVSDYQLLVLFPRHY
jgi:hypothetical protein